MQHVPPKRRLTFNGLHGVIFQKIGLFTMQFILLSKREKDFEGNSELF
jgi:hypothetical protein